MIDKGFDEGKARLNGVEVPIQCILLDVKKQHRGWNPHYHHYIEILYALDADINIYLNGNLFHFKSGDMVVINSKETHDLLFNADSRYICIKFSPEILYTGEQSVFELKYVMPFILENANHQRVFTKEECADGVVHDLITGIMLEWENKAYGYELAIRADILRLFLWILRYWNSQNIDGIGKFDLSDDLLHAIQTALEYVSAHYADCTAQDTAAACNLSYSYFSRTFKRIMHKSFTEYLNYVRITKAEQLLSTTDKSISEIAADVGFSTPSYFIQQFKAQKNLSPKQFRLFFSKEIREKEMTS